MRTIEPLYGGHTLVQSSSCFKLTQDSVLLADFIAVKPGERALELGCGAGALWVLAALHCPGCTIDGLELQPEALALALENQRRNGLAARGCLRLGDLRRMGPGHYDVVFCNPPYYSGGKAPADTARRLARSQQGCTFLEVCAAAGRALHAKGRFYFCWPARQLPGALHALAQSGLAPKTLRFVHQDGAAPAQLALVMARRSGGEIQVLPPLLLREEGGGESREYRRIYHRGGQERE